MNTNSELGMLKLTVSPLRDGEYIRNVVEQIQQLSGVARVRADVSTAQIEVVFRQPVEGLLRAIHLALRTAGTAVVAGKTY
ncbi:MAG: hypothetical protein WCS70_01910 [Verrucomicrobiota bacterium]